MNLVSLEAWFAIAGDVIVRSTAVLIVATALAVVLRKSSAAARHQVWLLATVAVLAMPMLTLMLPQWRVLPAKPQSPASPVAPAIAETVAPMEDDPPPAVVTTPSHTFSPAVQSAPRRTSLNLTWRHAVAAVWLLGVALTILPPLLGAISLRRLQRRAMRIADDPLLQKLSRQLCLRRPPILLSSADRDMPMTWGILRPKLLLPATFDTWPDDRRRAVMLHELAHVARRDCLWQWLGHFARATYWFHPLVWLAARQMCRERERACDDLVLASGANAPDYAEHLLRIASGLQPPAFSAHAAIAMARTSNLETRIVAILDPHTDRRRLTRAGVILLALLALLVPPLAMLRAQTTAPTTPLRVNTLDSADKPVAGVDVYVFHEIYPERNEENPHVVRVGPVKSDATGAATLQIPQPGAKSEWTRTSIFARVPGKQIGASIVTEMDKPQKILMAAAAPMKGKVNVPAGLSPRDVKVSMLSLMINDGTASSQSIYPGHGKWPELFEFPVAADGTFLVPEAPERGSVYLAGNAKGFGEAQFMSLETGPAGVATLNMRKEGVIEGTLTRESDNAPVAGVQILARPRGGGGDLFVTHPYTATTDAAGKFRIDGLPEAMFTLAPPWATSAPELVMPARENVLVKAGETTRDVKLQLERGAVVVGEVIESQTGKPVKGVHVAVIHPAASQDGDGIASSETDAEGRYVLRLPAGSSKLYLSGLPDGYVYPPESDHRIVDIAKGDADKQLPAIVLTPAKPRQPPGIAILRGRVVDASGKGVNGVAIADNRVEIWSMGEMPTQDDRAAVTDADGRFEFKVGAGIKHRLFVRNIEWQHDKTAEFTPAKDQTFTHPDIVVRERPVVGTITGVVVDPQGKPIEGVEVGFRSPIRTDASGKFSMEVRGETKPVMINLRKTGYVMRNWNDIPPNAKDVRFVLPPGTRPPYEEGRPQPPAPKESIGKPAPKFDVETWIHLPTAKPPDLSGGGSGRKTFVVFDWNCDEPATTRKMIAQLAAEAAKANGDAIVIFGPQSHETGVRAMLGNDRPNVSIGIDRFEADGKYDINGATMSTWGFGRMPHAFIVDEKGIVKHEQRGVTNLAGAAK